MNNGNGASATNKNDLYTYEYDTHTCGITPFTSSCAATLTGQETSPVTGTLVTATRRWGRTSSRCPSTPS